VKYILHSCPRFECQLWFYPTFFDFAFLPPLFENEASVYPNSVNNC
jgi:hypothetical protein